MGGGGGGGGGNKKRKKLNEKKSENPFVPQSQAKMLHLQYLRFYDFSSYYQTPH